MTSIAPNGNEAPVFAYDPLTRAVTIDGVRISRELFAYFASASPRRWFRFVKRSDGVVELEFREEL